MGVSAGGFGILSTNNHAPLLASVFSGGVLAAFSVSIPLQRGLGVLLSARRDFQHNLVVNGFTNSSSKKKKSDI
jgi:hypothetical protein